jgi:hypothetical protein
LFSHGPILVLLKQLCTYRFCLQLEARQLPLLKLGGTEGRLALNELCVCLLNKCSLRLKSSFFPSYPPAFTAACRHFHIITILLQT